MNPRTPFPMVYTVKEAAALAKVSRQTIRNAIHGERLPAYRPNGRDYRILDTDLQKWLNASLYENRI